MVSIGLEALRSGTRTGPGSQLGLWLFGGLLGGGRSFGRGREVVRSDGRPTVDGDLGLSLDGRSRGWVNRWVDRSGQIRSWLRSARVGAGHLEVLGSKSPFVIGRRIWISHHSDRALVTKG